MVCAFYPDLLGLCVAAFFLKGIPVIVLLVLIGFQIRDLLDSTKLSKLSLLIQIQGFLGSIFYFCALLADNFEDAAAVNSPTLICWESGVLTLLLSWRLLHKIVKDLKPFNTSQERNLIIGIITFNALLLVVIVPLHVASIFDPLEGFDNVFIFVHIGLVSVILILGVAWFVMLRKALAQALAETNHPAKRAIRRMMFLIAVIFVQILLTLSLQLAPINNPIAASVWEVVCGVVANFFFIYSQWPRTSYSGSSNSPGPQDTSQANSGITGSSVRPEHALPSESSALGPNVIYESATIGMAHPPETQTYKQASNVHEYQEL